jgi:ferredoxin
MVKYQIEVDQKLCIGCGACTVTCDNFISENNKAHAVNSEVDTIGCNQEAADACPVDAIKIEKIKEEKVDKEENIQKDE